MNTTVLVVDGEEAMVFCLAAILKAAGYAVRTAQDVGEAVACLREGQIDVALLDAMAPQAGGYAILEAVRADPQLACVRVVLTGVRSRSGDVEKALALGASAYLVKPFSVPHLLSVLSPDTEGLTAARARAHG
jgi:chemosensory pili system protein ChpA (sensor histidine kinase/response regulator)